MPHHLLILAATLILLPTTQADDKPDPQIQAVVDYFAKHGFKMEKSKGGLGCDRSKVRRLLHQPLLQEFPC